LDYLSFSNEQSNTMNNDSKLNNFTYLKKLRNLELTKLKVLIIAAVVMMKQLNK